MHLEDAIVIDRPIDEVWACLTDFFNVPLWGTLMLSIRQTSPGPLGVGSILQGRGAVAGFETRFDFVIKEWDPPHTLVWSFVGRPASSDARFALETVGDGTKLVRWQEIEGRGPLRFVLPFLGPFVWPRWHAGMRNLKRFIEAKPR